MYTLVPLKCNPQTVYYNTFDTKMATCICLWSLIYLVLKHGYKLLYIIVDKKEEITKLIDTYIHFESYNRIGLLNVKQSTCS